MKYLYNEHFKKLEKEIERKIPEDRKVSRFNIFKIPISKAIYRYKKTPSKFQYKSSKKLKK